jgi:hypothetical protein
MHGVLFRFYGELNDFLPATRRGRRFAHELRGPASSRTPSRRSAFPMPKSR